MKYIHQECLKKWFGDKDTTKEKLICEICKHVYKIDYEYEYTFSKKKMCSMLKNFFLVFSISAVILVLIDVLIMVVISSMNTFTEELRLEILHILVGVSTGILFIIFLTYFRDCKENYYDKHIINWLVGEYEKSIHLKLI